MTGSKRITPALQEARPSAQRSQLARKTGGSVQGTEADCNTSAGGHNKI